MMSHQVAPQINFISVIIMKITHFWKVHWHLTPRPRGTNKISFDWRFKRALSLVDLTFLPKVIVLPDGSFEYGGPCIWRNTLMCPVSILDVWIVDASAFACRQSGFCEEHPIIYLSFLNRLKIKSGRKNTKSKSFQALNTSDGHEENCVPFVFSTEIYRYR